MGRLAGPLTTVPSVANFDWWKMQVIWRVSGSHVTGMSPPQPAIGRLLCGQIRSNARNSSSDARKSATSIGPSETQTCSPTVASGANSGSSSAKGKPAEPAPPSPPPIDVLPRSSTNSHAAKAGQLTIAARLVRRNCRLSAVARSGASTVSLSRGSVIRPNSRQCFCAREARGRGRIRSRLHRQRCTAALHRSPCRA